MTAAEDTEDCGWEERDDYWDDDLYWDDEENVSSNPYYNDDLDMDQQSPEFWDSIFWQSAQVRTKPVYSLLVWFAY